jgi:hypothetical protein
LYNLSTFWDPPSLIYHKAIVAIVKGPAKLQYIQILSDTTQDSPAEEGVGVKLKKVMLNIV